MRCILPLIVLTGCTNLSCAEIVIDGETPITYIDNGKRELPLTGVFGNRCTARRDPAQLNVPGGMDLGIHFDPSISSDGTDSLLFTIDVDHRKRHVDWNIALGWNIRVEVPLSRIRTGETVRFGDGITTASHFWDGIQSAGDQIVSETGPDVSGEFVFYTPGPLEAEMTFSRVRAKGDDPCAGGGSNWVEIKASFDLAWGTPGETEAWSTVVGEDWFSAPPELACAGLLTMDE